MTKNLISCLFIAAALSLTASAQDRMNGNDSVQVQVGNPGNQMPLHFTRDFRSLGPVEFAGPLYHPYVLVARHPKPGCVHTEMCGEIFYTFHGHNMRTSAGTTWQFNQMGGTTAAAIGWLALTNTAVVPAEADTTLSGEIVANGLSRHSATVTQGGPTLGSTPPTPTTAVTGSTGTTYYYWIASCSQGICTLPGADASASAAATLNATNYVTVSWVPVVGATSYQVFRTGSAVAPSGGPTSDLVNATTNSPFQSFTASSCTGSNGTGSCSVVDNGTALAAVTVPGSNLTNYGVFTVVYTWTCTTTAQSAQAFGAFNAASSGTMTFEGTFTQVSLNVNDTFQLTETVYF